MPPRIPPSNGIEDGLVIERVAEIASTNVELLERASLVATADAPADADAVWLIAGRQTGGRGRRGRRWIADPATSLTASLGLVLPAGVDPGPIPLVAGAAIAETLATIGARPWLKWPNDVYVLDAGRPAKAGGILCELRFVASGPAGLRLVVGCGLNLLRPPPLDAGDGTGAAPAPVGHLFERLVTAERERLEVALGTAILDAIRDLVRHGAGAGLARWSRFDLLVGRPVRVHDSAGVVDTVARGIDAAGRLVVDDPTAAAGRRCLVAEEVSVRWAASPAPAAAADTLSPCSDT